MEPLEQTVMTKKGGKEKPLHYCKECDYNCCNLYSWDRHLSTSKHINRTNLIVLEQKGGNVTKNIKKLNCKYCNKCYTARNSLWYHEKICVASAHIEKEEPEPTDKEMIMMMFKQNTEIIKEHSDLIKDNSDMKQLILELVKNGITTNNSHNNTITNTNSHNKAFNLNFFLNETCKNAMNITEFVDSIKWELEDLMELGEIGYVASMSKIITKNLNALDETVRPIHCTDKKRETFYIKDEDKWEKEDEEMKRLRKIILRISNKSMKLLPKYREKFPDYDDAKSIRSDELCKIIIEAVTCDSAKDEKIIRNISKATMISKEALQVV